MVYEKKVKYLDYLEGGMRVRGGGFAKLEVRDGTLRMEVSVTGLHHTDTFVRDVMLCGRDKEAGCGKIEISAGKGKFGQQWRNLESIGGTRISYGELCGIRIPMGAGREVSGRWQEEGRNILGQADEFKRQSAPAETVRRDMDRSGGRTADQAADASVKGTPEKGMAEREVFADSKDILESEMPAGKGMILEEASGVEETLTEAAVVGELQGSSMESENGERQKQERIKDMMDGMRSGREEIHKEERYSHTLDETEAGGEQERGTAVWAVQSQGREGISVETAEREENQGRSVRAWESPDNDRSGISVETAERGRRQRRSAVTLESPDNDRNGMGRTAVRHNVGSVEWKEDGDRQRRPPGASGRTPPVKLMEDKWSQLWAIYPHIRPFQDEREYLSIGPADFVLFPEASYKAVNNSFLLHGYYNYHHLLLARVERRGEYAYYIGVPGNFYEREKQVAIMFGFESFECAEEPAQAGDFGYYMMRAQI